MRFLGPLVFLLAIAASISYLYNARQQYENSPEGKAALAETAQLEEIAKKSAGTPQEKFCPKLLLGLDKAKTANQKVVLVFTTSWCGTCQWMEKEVLPSPVLQPQARRFTWVFLDGDERANLATKQEFGIHGFPTIIVLNQAGKELERFEGGPDAELFSEFLAKY